MLTTRQAAKLLGVSRVTLRRYFRQGLIHPLKLPGGAYRLSNEELERFLSECQEARGTVARAAFEEHHE